MYVNVIVVLAILQLGNNILRILGATQIVQDVGVFFSDAFYIQYFDAVFPQLGIGQQMQEAETEEEMAMNIQDLIDLLGGEVLRCDLSSISGAEIVTGNAEHCIELLKLLMELALELDEDEDDEGELDPNDPRLQEQLDPRLAAEYGDEYDDDMDEETYEKLLMMKQAREMQEEQLRKEEELKQQQAKGQKGQKGPKGQKQGEQMKKGQKPEIQTQKSPDGRGSISKNSGQSSTKSAKDDYMRRKLGEKQVSNMNHEEIDEFEDFINSDSKTGKDQTKNTKKEDKKAQDDDKKAQEEARKKEEAKKKEDEAKAQAERNRHEEEKRKREEEERKEAEKKALAKKVVDSDSDDEEDVKPKKKVEVDDEFKDYDEELEYDEEEEEEEDKPYVPPQIGGSNANQFVDFRADNKGFDAQPTSMMANQYLFTSQPQTNPIFCAQIKQLSSEAEPTPPVLPITSFPQKQPSTHPQPKPLIQQKPTKHEEEEAESEQYKDEEFEQEIEEDIPEDLEDEQSEQSVHLSQPKFPIDITPAQPTTQKRQADLSESHERSSLNRSQVSHTSDQPKFPAMKFQQPIQQQQEQQQPVTQTKPTVPVNDKPAQPKFSYPVLLSDQESSSQNSNSFFKGRATTIANTSHQQSTLQQSHKDTQYSEVQRQKRDEGIQYQSQDFKNVELFKHEQRQSKDQQTQYEPELLSSASERAVPLNNIGVQSQEIGAQIQQNQQAHSIENFLDIKGIEEMSEQERFQLLIYMEGEYDKNPSLFPFPKEMIEDYILNSHPIQKKPGESIDVTQSSHAMKQNRLLLAKKKIRSKSKKAARPKTATVETTQKPVRSSYGVRKNSTKAQIQSPTQENKTPNIAKKMKAKSVRKQSLQQDAQPIVSEESEEPSKKMSSQMKSNSKRPQTAKGPKVLKLKEYPKPPKKRTPFFSQIALPQSIQDQLKSKQLEQPRSASKSERRSEQKSTYVLAQSKTKSGRPQSAKPSRTSNKKVPKPKINSDHYMNFLINNYVSQSDAKLPQNPSQIALEELLSKSPKRISDQSELSQQNIIALQLTQSEKLVKDRKIPQSAQKNDYQKKENLDLDNIHCMEDNELDLLIKSPKSLSQEQQIQLQQVLLSKIQQNIRSERAYYYQNIYQMLMSNLSTTKDKMTKSFSKEGIQPTLALIKQKQDFDRLYMEYHQEEQLKKQAVRSTEALQKQEQKTLEIMEKKFKDQLHQNQKMISYKRDEFQKSLCQKVYKLATELEKSKMVDQKKVFREDEKRKKEQNQRILTSMDTYYKDRIQILKENIYNTKFERQIAVQSQREILERMKRDLNDKKKREIEKYLSVLKTKDANYSKTNYNPKLSQDIINQFKRK